MMVAWMDFGMVGTPRTSVLIDQETIDRGQANAP